MGYTIFSCGFFFKGNNPSKFHVLNDLVPGRVILSLFFFYLWQNDDNSDYKVISLRGECTLHLFSSHRLKMSYVFLCRFGTIMVQVVY